MSINTGINNLGWFQILAKLCRDFHSFNDASHCKPNKLNLKNDALKGVINEAIKCV